MSGTSTGRTSLVTRWIGLSMVIGSALIGGTMYVADVKSEVQRLQDRQDTFERTVMKRLDSIGATLNEIERHLRPFREFR